MNCHTAFTIESYAKVNLTLDVLDRRFDGFHSIESVMQTIGLHDTITLQLEDRPGIRITCNVPGIPTDQNNLAWKAADAFFRRFQVSHGLTINIDKAIPFEAGLGGGSSNAAAVLMGLAQILVLSTGESDLLALALQVGSDVPYFLTGGTAFVQGRGEKVIGLPDLPSRALLVVKPPFGVSTAWCYRRLDEMRDSWQPQKSGTFSGKVLVCIERDGCTSLPSLLGNDLEAPAFEDHPEIRAIKEDLIHAGAQGALMCGSGSAVFGLFDSESHALAAAKMFDSRGQVYVTQTIGRRQV